MSNASQPPQRCVGCRTRAPDTDTEYTLISSRYGWRLTRRIERDGTFVMEWRCPACWQAYKAEKQMAPTPPDGLPSVGDVRPATGSASRPMGDAPTTPTPPPPRRR
jgi:hypothetical protein